jgi:hypothetical protein
MAAINITADSLGGLHDKVIFITGMSAPVV